MISVNLYRLCLRIYPSEFRSEFSNEMLETFSDRLNDTDNRLQAMTVIAQELLDVLPNAFAQHIGHKKQQFSVLPYDMQNLVQARWIIRIASLMNVLFFILVSLESCIDRPQPETLLMPVLFGLQLACVMFALRWERIGGIIMLTTTLTIASIIFMSIALPGFEIIALLASILWGLPFGGFATAYLVIGQRQFQFQRQAIL